ncbi:hypothetical protein [Thiothrix nivea]|uniref:Uncharacterized protein n=1 Tax=Thiothrix nivea (strain ATCC 35100 / DSM 5205 / JP2) TaxID=870187 RepID=A0A656HGM7_THINJ|nr:hypothetical protein [Thiothrix nivea]EIJ34540.1 hypothetical protein Thini_1966 [Thiothrix nivea DSM 5205]
MSHECTHKCVMEFPPAFKDQLTATIGVDLLEAPEYAPVNIIKKGQKYVVRVCVELNAQIKKLICADWCICVAAESIGIGQEGEICETLCMDNCNPEPDCIDIEVPGEWLGEGDVKCGRVFYMVVTVVALDKCDKKPIGIAGFCRVGPVMVFGD